jgi:CheY-like chemotaxis protein
MTVLLVDDEPEVRSIAATILRASGHRVLEAGDAEEALKVLLADDHIALLLTDLAMPKMGGLDLADVAKATRPDLRVLFTSAYVSSDTEGSPAFRHGPLVEKPWRAIELEREVRRLIGPASPLDMSGRATRGEAPVP